MGSRIAKMNHSRTKIDIQRGESLLKAEDAQLAAVSRDERWYWSGSRCGNDKSEASKTCLDKSGRVEIEGKVESGLATGTRYRVGVVFESRGAADEV